VSGSGISWASAKHTREPSKSATGFANPAGSKMIILQRVVAAVAV